MKTKTALPATWNGTAHRTHFARISASSSGAALNTPKLVVLKWYQLNDAMFGKICADAGGRIRIRTAAIAFVFGVSVALFTLLQL
jgi:hypothetical protein